MDTKDTTTPLDATTTLDTTTTLPNNFSDSVMEFAKISTEAYHSGVLQGEIKALGEVKTEIQRKLDDAQARYDKTTVGAIMKKTRDG